MGRSISRHHHRIWRLRSYECPAYKGLFLQESGVVERCMSYGYNVAGTRSMIGTSSDARYGLGGQTDHTHPDQNLSPIAEREVLIPSEMFAIADSWDWTIRGRFYGADFMRFGQFALKETVNPGPTIPMRAMAVGATSSPATAMSP
jgi:hypothetical protein